MSGSSWNFMRLCPRRSIRQEPERPSILEQLKQPSPPHRLEAPVKKTTERDER